MDKIDWREASRKLDKMFINKQSEPKDDIDLFSELQEKNLKPAQTKNQTIMKALEILPK